MRKLVTAAMAALLMALAAPAFAADGPAGTSEGQDNVGTEADPIYENNNQTECGSTDDAVVDTEQGIMVKAAGGADGGALVICNEGGNDAPVQGRVMAAGSTDGGWVAVDGDGDNPEQGQGWARVDIGATPGAGCGDTTTGDTDAANPAGPLSTATCG